MSRWRSERATRTLGLTVAVCAVAGGIAGVTTSAPTPVPSYALQSELIYKGIVGLALFFALYVVVVLVWLAYHGLTPNKITASGAEFPDPLLLEAGERYEAAAKKLAEAGELVADDLERRVAALESERRRGQHGA